MQNRLVSFAKSFTANVNKSPSLVLGFGYKQKG
jgi:hypothetical protein